jgi:2-amino-4-hydroxy-6-hydroxymethyldihydropteridine diphosphokinase
MTLAYVGLGANLGDREATILRAAELIQATRISTLYESAPWGVIDQPDFFNAVAEVNTEIGARPFLDRLLEVERELGRVRDGKRWGPRIIDLDLLVYGDVTSDTAALTLPHPRLHERLFVLVPWAEIAPDVVVPGLGTVTDLLTELQSAHEPSG